MKRLILATVSALALGIAGAGVGYAAEPVHPRPMPQGTQVSPSVRTQSAHGAQAENWSKSRIEQVQHRLKAAGAYNGPINGELNAQTEHAIARFQGAHGLHKTGTLDQRTLAALGNVSPSGATPSSHAGGSGAAMPRNQGR
jgi:peptidoglycan hydrolase-like protein with peptidoglycan-binding domain